MKRSTLVIGFDGQKENSKELSRPPESPNENRGQNPTFFEREKSCISKKCFFIIIGVSIAVVIGIIVLAVMLTKNKSKGDQPSQKKPDQTDNPELPQESPNESFDKPEQESPFTPVVPIEKEKEKMLETEFEFKQKVGELYRLNVKQKSNEEIKSNGFTNYQFIGRNTNYDIFFISEKNSTEENKYYYNSTFLAAILISSQCIDTTNDNCEPEPYIGLTNINRRNLRSLDEIPDLKDKPLPICLFNITNNDVITSIKCHESLPKNIRRNMILDLYFFRPPAIKRPDKKKGNVTITKTKINENEFIRETNGGICDVVDPFKSFCTTDMNTTVNPEGKILTYDEEAFTNITQDKNNSYIKEKITNLKDESEKVAHVNKVEYKEALDILLEKLNPYFKYYEQFSEEEFKELYKASKNISGDIDINSGVQRRNLRAEKQEEEALSNEETLFNYTHYTDTKLLINLRNEPGYNSESMQAQVNLKYSKRINRFKGIYKFR